MRLIALPSCRTSCTFLSDGRGGLPVEAVFEDVVADELAAALASAPVPPDVPYGCLLVRAPDALVLVDAGLGAAEHPFGGSGGELWAELERAAGEWSHWTSPAVLDELSPFAAGPAREQLPPLQGVLEQISEEVEVADGVRLIPAPGHTPAHLAVEVGESGGLLFAVDALLHPLQARRPDWGHGLDHDIDAAVATRRALLARAADRGHVIAASHWDDVVAP